MPLATIRTRKAYTPLQIITHWMTALLIILQWYTSRGVLRTHQIHPIYYKPDPFHLVLHKLHIYGGVAILGLVLLRLMLRWRHGAPELPSTVPPWTARLAQPTHVAMYLVLAALSVTGLITTYIWFGMSSAHKLLVNLLYGLVFFHVGAAIWHDSAHRAGLLARMLPGRFRLLL